MSDHCQINSWLLHVNCTTGLRKICNNTLRTRPGVLSLLVCYLVILCFPLLPRLNLSPPQSPGSLVLPPPLPLSPPASRLSVVSSRFVSTIVVAAGNCRL